MSTTIPYRRINLFAGPGAEILFLLSDAGLPYTTVRHDDYDALWRIVTSGT